MQADIVTGAKTAIRIRAAMSEAEEKNIVTEGATIVVERGSSRTVERTTTANAEGMTEAGTTGAGRSETVGEDEMTMDAGGQRPVTVAVATATSETTRTGGVHERTLAAVGMKTIHRSRRSGAAVTVVRAAEARRVAVGAVMLTAAAGGGGAGAGAVVRPSPHSPCPAVRVRLQLPKTRFRFQRTSGQVTGCAPNATSTTTGRSSSARSVQQQCQREVPRHQYHRHRLEQHLEVRMTMMLVENVSGASGTKKRRLAFCLIGCRTWCNHRKLDPRPPQASLLTSSRCCGWKVSRSALSLEKAAKRSETSVPGAVPTSRLTTCHRTQKGT